MKDTLCANAIELLSQFSREDIIDLKGQYLLPGTINLYVHIPGSGEPKNMSIRGKLIENPKVRCYRKVEDELNRLI